MINTIWGFGDLVITSLDDSNQVTFTNVIHKIYYTKTNIRQTSIVGNIHQTEVYFRPVVEAQIINGCSDTDIDGLLNLIQIFNNGTFYVTPQNGDINTQNITYQMYIDSQSIDFQHLSTAQLGQILTIKFIGKSLTKLPTNYSNPQTYTMIDYNDDIYIDDIGDILILSI